MVRRRNSSYGGGRYGGRLFDDVRDLYDDVVDRFWDVEHGLVDTARRVTGGQEEDIADKDLDEIREMLEEAYRRLARHRDNDRRPVVGYERAYGARAAREELQGVPAQLTQLSQAVESLAQQVRELQSHQRTTPHEGQ